MDNRKIRLFDSMGAGRDYQDDLLRKISQTLKQEVALYRVWETEKVNGMEEQNDSNNCGVFVTAWAENALITGRVNNCIKRGNE